MRFAGLKARSVGVVSVGLTFFQSSAVATSMTVLLENRRRRKD